MKTLITTVAVLTLSFAPLSAKDGTFTTVVMPDDGKSLQITLSSRQWIKIINFSQNAVDERVSTNRAGIAIFKGENALWALFATDPTMHEPHEDLIVAGPATLVVSPPDKTQNGANGGATVFLTYQRGSD